MLALAPAIRAADLPRPLSEMIATEQRFAKTCGETGLRDSFLKFFADNVITFSATDIRTGTDYLQKQPPSAADDPRLEWEPVYGDIATSGDLGYLTGPYTVTPRGGPARHGQYFSVWKKQPAGEWKVVLDAGLPTREAAPKRPFTRAPGLQQAAPHAGASGDAAAAERSLADAAAKSQAQAFAQYGAPTLRLHRATMQPISGMTAAKAQFADSPVQYEATASGVSSAGDLAYVVGRYRSGAGKGLYVRVWQKHAGRWFVTVDSMDPAP